MRKTRRRIINDRRRFKTGAFFILIILLVTLAIGAYAYNNNKNTPSHLSPIPENYDITTNVDAQKGIESIEEKLGELEIEFREVKRGENYFAVTLADDSTVIMSRDKDMDTQIASLQLILTRLTMEGRTFKSLDLRYNKPIVRE